MMKAGFVAAVSALALAGCGAGEPSDRQVLVNVCIADGEAKATCNCIADVMQKNLSPELFGNAVLINRASQAVDRYMNDRDRNDVVPILGELTVEEQRGFSEAVASCGGRLYDRLNNRLALIDACIADGEIEATCGCITHMMDMNLPTELFSKTADAIARDKKQMTTFVGELTILEQRAFSTVVSKMFACSLTGEPAE